MVGFYFNTRSNNHIEKIRAMPYSWYRNLTHILILYENNNCGAGFTII